MLQICHYHYLCSVCFKVMSSCLHLWLFAEFLEMISYCTYHIWIVYHCVVNSPCCNFVPKQCSVYALCTTKVQVWIFSIYLALFAIYANCNMLVISTTNALIQETCLISYSPKYCICILVMVAWTAHMAIRNETFIFTGW